MDETKVQIGEEVLLDIGIHPEWYISSTGYDGESVDITLRKKADRIQKWWFSEAFSTDGKPYGLALQSSDGSSVELVPAPSIDIVLCRECKHWQPHEQYGYDEDNDEYHDYCGLLVPEDDYYAIERRADDFCSYGEREGE